MPSSSNKSTIKKKSTSKKHNNSMMQIVINHRTLNPLQTISNTLNELGYSKDLNYNQVHYREQKNADSSTGDGRQIMNDQERIQYCQWLTSMGEISLARNRSKQRKAIYDILKFRRDNNAKLFSSERRPLNKNENRVVDSYETEGTYTLPSDDWFRSFNIERDEIKERSSSQLDVDRSNQMTVPKVQSHLAELENMLRRLKILTVNDDGTHRITTNRFINFDECGQPIDFEPGAGEKVVIGSEKKNGYKSHVENRESITINGCIGLDGFEYGPHLIIAGKIGTTNLDVSDELEKYGITETFSSSNPSCDSKTMKSDHLLISFTECGMQTGVSVVGFLEFLCMQLEERGVELPAILATDGHSSRFFELANEWFLNNQHRLQLFLEPPKSSMSCQALDKIHRKLHSAYGKSRTYLKTLIANTSYGGNESLVPFGKTEFLVALRLWWFNKYDPVLIKTAFQRVGVSATGLSINFIDISDFKKEPVLTLIEHMKSDRSGSRDSSSTDNDTTTISSCYETRSTASNLTNSSSENTLENRILKLEAEVAYLKEQQKDGYFDCKAVLNVPINTEKSKSKSKLVLSKYGDITHRDLHSQIKEKHNEANELVVQKGVRKVAKEAKKDAKYLLIARFNICMIMCNCEMKEACIFVGKKLCPICQDIKKNVCCKAACLLKIKEQKSESISPVHKKSKASSSFSASVDVVDSIIIPTVKLLSCLDYGKGCLGVKGQVLYTSYIATLAPNELQDVNNLLVTTRASAKNETILNVSNTVSSGYVSKRRLRNNLKALPITSLPLTKEDIVSLSAVTTSNSSSSSLYLSSMIINSYIILLEKREQLKLSKDSNYIPTGYLNTDQTAHLLSTYRENVVDTTSSFEIMVNSINSKFDIFRLKFLFLPINIANLHWHLFLVDMDMKIVYLIDSLQHSNSNKYIETFQCISAFLSEVYLLRKFVSDSDGWTFKILTSPQQTNGVDCGVFVCLSMSLLSDNVELNYGMREVSIFRNFMLNSFQHNEIRRHWLDNQQDIVIKFTN